MTLDKNAHRGNREGDYSWHYAVPGICPDCDHETLAEQAIRESTGWHSQAGRIQGA